MFPQARGRVNLCATVTVSGAIVLSIDGCQAGELVKVSAVIEMNCSDESNPSQPSTIPFNRVQTGRVRCDTCCFRACWYGRRIRRHVPRSLAARRVQWHVEVCRVWVQSVDAVTGLCRPAFARAPKARSIGDGEAYPRNARWRRPDRLERGRRDAGLRQHARRQQHLRSRTRFAARRDRERGARRYDPGDRGWCDHADRRPARRGQGSLDRWPRRRQPDDCGQWLDARVHDRRCDGDRVDLRCHDQQRPR